MKEARDLLNRAYKKILNNCLSRTDWTAILKKDGDLWNKFKKQAMGGHRILIATSTGGHEAMTPVESLLAAALTVRGADVRFLLCDGVLGACQQMVVADFKDAREFAVAGPPPAVCKKCFNGGMDMYQPLGLPIDQYSQALSPEDHKSAQGISREVPFPEISSYRLHGAAVGEHAMAGALRYFARGDLDREPHGEAVLRRYFEAALISLFTARAYFKKHRIDTVLFHHGIYVPQGLIGEVARQMSIHVVNWNVAYKKQCFIFSHGNSYHHTLREESVKNWESIPMTAATEECLTNYLKSRWTGDEDWVWFHEKPDFENSRLVRETGIDLKKPIIGLLTNVAWDAKLHYPAVAFPDMFSWFFKTIEYFKKRPDVQLLVRVHPAEIHGIPRSRQPLLDELRKKHPSLPPNVFIVGPDSRISTYAAMQHCKAVIIYGTKTGVELCAMGIPVVVAGEAWIRGKGLTYDANSSDHYFQLLDQLPNLLNFKDTLARARRYAFHFFFRRMIPLNFLKPRAGWPPFKLSLRKLEDIQPGRNPALDVICDGVLFGSEFIYRAENIIEKVNHDTWH